jgi:hypothetical protein
VSVPRKFSTDDHRETAVWRPKGLNEAATAAGAERELWGF